eukprot:GHVN01052882.1.p2 GENE.GHVN01052882.1~~GHVN01052882.1.p2  ORF type:complete len:148 (-),score=27.66 GHVN01052882.1:249-692(-)
MDGDSGLTADLMVRGVWEPQEVALLDIRVTDTDATSYLNRTTQQILSEQEREKKTMFAEECRKRRAAFTPFVTSVDGALGSEAKAFMQAIGRQLSKKWAMNYSQTMHWVRTRLSFAIIRATHVCLRGSRMKWRSLGVEDGGGLMMNF